MLAAAAPLIVFSAAALSLFHLVSERDVVDDLNRQPGGWIGVVFVVLCSAVVHEALHAIGWIAFAGVSSRSISFRRSWRVMGFVAHTETPIPAPAYRASTALPALALALPTIVLAFALRSWLILLWGLFFLLECFSDIATLLATRKA